MMDDVDCCLYRVEINGNHGIHRGKMCSRQWPHWMWLNMSVAAWAILGYFLTCSHQLCARERHFYVVMRWRSFRCVTSWVESCFGIDVNIFL